MARRPFVAFQEPAMHWCLKLTPTHFTLVNFTEFGFFLFFFFVNQEALERLLLRVHSMICSKSPVHNSQDQGSGHRTPTPKPFPPSDDAVSCVGGGLACWLTSQVPAAVTAAYMTWEKRRGWRQRPESHPHVPTGHMQCTDHVPSPRLRAPTCGGRN